MADGLAPPPAPEEAGAAALRRIMRNIFVKHILMFKFIALNKATHAVYYDLVSYSDYDEANIDRLRRTTFKAKSNGILGFDLAQAADWFFRHAVLPDIPIPEESYRALLAEALGLCEAAEIV